MVQLTRRAVILGFAGLAIAPVVGPAQEEETGTSDLLAQLPGLEAAWGRR